MTDTATAAPLDGAMDIGVGILGPGAIADYHADALHRLGARLVAACGPHPEENQDFAARHNLQATYIDAADLLARDDIDAVVVTSPSPMHSEQAIAALTAGKHLLCEIPIAMNYPDALAAARAAAGAGTVATVAHTLRDWAPHLELRQRIQRNELDVRHLVARALQLRQTNVGWTGRPRDWTDHILWHHAAHLVDAALWLLDATDVDVAGGCGPIWPATGTPMDVAITLRSADGALATLSLSFHSRIAVSDYLVVAEDQTYEIRDGRLHSPDGVVVDGGGTAAVQIAAIDAQDREFLQAIIEQRPTRFTIEDALPTMRVLQQTNAGFADPSSPHG